MRIAFIIERMDVARGGRERSTAEVAEALARRGHQVTVVCQDGSWKPEGVEVRRLGRRGGTRAGRLRGFVADVQEHLLGSDYDIAHATLPVPGANVYQPRGGTVPAQRDAAWARRTWLGQLLAVFGERFNAHRRVMDQLEQEVVADPGVLCLAVSEMVALEFAQYYGRGGRLRVVYNGVAVPDPNLPQRARWRRDRRREIGADDDALVLLTVATNFELKGVLETIEAFARLCGTHVLGGSRRRSGPPPDARLVVVGRHQPEFYSQRAGVHDLGEQVFFFGPTEDVFEWYAAADAVVLLSWYDPCSRVVLEAIRWGIPSITTASNGAAEKLEDGAGVVVGSPRDTAGVVAAMERMADPEARREMAAACRAVADEVGVERHVEELLAAYAQLLGGGVAGGTA